MTPAPPGRRPSNRAILGLGLGLALCVVVALVLAWLLSVV